ncbi:MAG: penicillin-binding protein 1A, partial [bacterium]
LYDLGKIDKLSMETARKAPITAERHIAEVELQAPYVAEMARQYLVNRMGSDAYGQGLNVTLTIRSDFQDKANQSLRKGLLDYDVRHGYRGAAGKIEFGEFEIRDVLELLHEYPASQELVPAVVITVKKSGFSALTRDGEEIRIPLDKMTWAAKYITPNSQGPEPAASNEVVAKGDVVYVVSGGDNEWKLSQMPEISGALVSLDSKTGAILALTGGFDYYLSKFNRAIQAERQPGSNIKPFIYSAALDNGFTPSSLVSGAPIVVEDNLEGIWRPENYSKKFFGPTRLRKALSLSLNLVSVRLLRAIGIEPTIKHLEKFGFDREKLPRSLSLSLGSTAITPLEIARGYSVFANGGKLNTPYFIEKIEDADGNPVALLPEQSESCANCDTKTDDNQIDLSLKISPLRTDSVQTLSPQNAFLTSSLMKQVILSGTGRRALALGRGDLAGKTGTTNNFRDAWFSGFNPDVTTTVFVGFDEPAHLGRRESGASAALPVWVDYMGTALSEYPEQTQSIPERIVVRFINKENGQLTATNDPEGFDEYFMVGTEPTNIVNPVVGTSNENNGQSTSTNQNVSESLF